MKFIVRKCGSNVKPCKEAHQETITVTETITEHGLHEFETEAQWFEHGSNHINNGLVYHRDIPYMVWTITLNSLFDLSCFISEVKEFTVSKSFKDTDIPVIDLY